MFGLEMSMPLDYRLKEKLNAGQTFEVYTKLHFYLIRGLKMRKYTASK